MSSNPLRLVLIGPPASGKGTQGRRLSAAFGVPYLSTGALLRDHMAQQTAIGRLARPILDQGGYLPDDVMCGMIGEWLEQAGPSWILDGFPRSVPQAEFLEHKLLELNRPLSAVVSLEAPFERLSERIHGRVECPGCRWSGGLGELAAAGLCPQCGGPVEPREDDSEANVTSRHRAFVHSAQPLVAHYRERGLLCSCDATLPRDEVTSQLMRQLSCLPAGRS